MVLVCVLLGAGALLAYWPVVRNEFVNYDDSCYVVLNSQIHAGLTWQGLAWAFGRLHGDHTYWHPITWISHMLDCQLFGLKPAGHHLVNLLFHLLNSVLVFVVFRRLTHAFWRSAILAGLFSLHPLQVDSVAWVAERKNLLGGLFFLLTLWAYGRYAEVREKKTENEKLKAESGKLKAEISEPFGVTDHASRIPHHSSRIPHPASRFYLLSLFFFVLGLMSKPVLVTLPFVLFLLDYWPLRRLSSFEVQRSGFRVQGSLLDVRCWMLDVGCSVSSPTQGLVRLLLEKLPFLALSAVSSLITVSGNRAVGALIEPSAGFPLAIRLQNAAFSYVKYLGNLFWPVNLAVFYPYPEQFPAWRVMVCGLFLLALLGLALVTRSRRPYLLVGWLWFLGVLVPFIGLVQAGEQGMADRFIYVPLIGLLLALVWGMEEMTRGWRRQGAVGAVAVAAVLGLYGFLSHRQAGYWQNSVTLFTHSLEATGDNARAHSNLGQALAAQGKTEEGIQHLLQAIRLNPEHAIAHWAIGCGRDGQGRTAEAIAHYEAALRLKPDFPEALNNLAWIRATHPGPQYRNGAAAVSLAEQACRLTSDQEAMFIGTLAAAYAEAGRFEDAVKTAEKARDLALAAGQKELADRNRQLLELYRAGKPYHETKGETTD